MTPNRAFWQDGVGIPGVIRENLISSPLEDSKVLIKVHAWAMNPCDFMLQDQELPFVKYPVILGQDVAGTVEDVGSVAASKFKRGDRVFGLSFTNGFQDFVQLEGDFIARIPEGYSYKDVVVFPLCITTSAVALFDSAYLGLPFPSLEPKEINKSILIWGGSSAVGSNAIQLAKCAGLKVVTTCSPRSFDYVKGLGADIVFDYNSPTVVEDAAAELDKGICAGIYLAAGLVSEACKVSAESNQDLFVASSNPIMPGDAPEGVRAKFTFGTGGLNDFRSTIPVTFGGFLPDALAKGVYRVAPPPRVIATKGLEGVQEALDILKKGTSATKVVVEAK